MQQLTLGYRLNREGGEIKLGVMKLKHHKIKCQGVWEELVMWAW